MSQFYFENVIVYHTHSFIPKGSFNKLWAFSFNFVQDMPMWTRWNSIRYHEKTPTQEITCRKPITLPPTKTDVVRETIIQPLKSSAECCSKYTVTLHTTFCKSYKTWFSIKSIPPLIVFLWCLTDFMRNKMFFEKLEIV